MTRESLYYKILSAIHIVFFTSLLCGGTIFLSGTLLMIPALGAAFQIGKDAIYKELNINDSIVRTFFRYLKSSFRLIKFVPINLVIILNVAGMIIAARANYTMYSVVCLAIISFLMVLVLYLTGYYVFVDEKVTVIEVVFSMLLKPQFLMPIFAIMVLCISFFSVTLLIILFITGTFFLFAIEVLIFIQMLHYKKLTGNLDDEDEFAYLVSRNKIHK